MPTHNGIFIVTEVPIRKARLSADYDCSSSSSRHRLRNTLQVALESGISTQTARGSAVEARSAPLWDALRAALTQALCTSKSLANSPSVLRAAAARQTLHSLEP